MCNAHTNPALVTPLDPEALELSIALDEWRRSRTRDEQFWSSGDVVIVLTTTRMIEVRVGLLIPYAAQVAKRADYLEAKRAAIAGAQALVESVAERAELIANYRYPGERDEVEEQARLFLLDWTTEIHELYERFAPLERALPAGNERDISASISQALANTIF